MYIRVILFFAAILVIFSHFYFGFKSVIPSNSIARYNFLWLIVLLVFLSGMIGMVVFFMKGIGEQNILVNIILLVNFLIVIPVAIMSIFMLSLDFIRFLSSFILWIGQQRSMFPMVAAPVFIYKSIAYIGLFFAVLVLWGGTLGKYWFKVHEQHLYFNDLPKEFEGFKIVQISDIHTGSIDYKKAIEKAVAKINELNPDVILFTGDLVNVRATEALPFIPIFDKMKATNGMYSVLGNHDYASYGDTSLSFKNENLALLIDIHKQMGFNLLMNKAMKISRGNAQIFIAGVENWGLPPFPDHGDIDKALNETNATDFKVLLSHDPSHWDEQVKKHTKNVQLTLSGHTHGMQFGIELPWFKWSPVSLKYPKWAGIYNEAEKMLYVNRGLGFVGYPGRVGIRPEITLIVLHTK